MRHAGRRQSIGGRCCRVLAAVLVVLTAARAEAGIDVRVRGLGDEERDNAYATLAILEYAKRVDVEREAAKKAGTAPDSDQLNGDYDAEEVQRLYEQGPKDIAKALQPYGWYKPQVKSSIEGAAPDWVVTYDVVALPQTTVKTVTVELDGEGKALPALTRIRDRHWPLREGQRLKHQDYEDLKGRLLSTAQANGFLDAQFTKRELRIDLDNNSADVVLALDTGPRYFFGDYVIEQAGIEQSATGGAEKTGTEPAGMAPASSGEGQKPKLKDTLLRRYVKIEPGAPYEQQKVLETQFSLSDLGYFQSVEIEPKRSLMGADRHIPLVIHTTPRKNRLYKYGVGYGTDTGARALFGAEFRRVNDDGHKLRFELRPSQIDSAGLVEYKIPVGTNATDTVSFLGKLQNVKLTDGKEQIATAETALNRTFGKLTRRVYLDYIIDNFAFNDSPDVHSKLLTPGVTFNYLDVDDPIFARRGFAAFLDVHGAADDVISDTQFLSTRVQFRGVLPLDDLWSDAPRRKYRLLGRIEQGVVVSRNFELLPPSQRFFAGGDDSVRGYGYQSIGPRNANGKVVGGRYLTVGSAEIEYALTKSWGLATFVDGGGADDVPQVSLHYGAGVGVRYRAPFGSVAVDLAHPFDQDESPVRLHLGVRVGL